MKLLFLPTVVRQEVLVRMGFIELFDLSTISPLLKQIVKKDVKVRNHDISLLYYNSHFEIHFISEEDETTREIICIASDELLEDNGCSIRKIGNFENVMSKFSTRSSRVPTLNTYWTNQIEGADGVLTELNDIFSMTPTDIEIDVGETGYDHQDVVSWAFNLDRPLDSILITGENRDSEVYEWVLQQRITGAPNIGIESRYLTHEAIQKYLRSLRTGCHPNLEEMHFKLYRFMNPERLLNGLEATEEEDEWSFQLDNGDQCVVCAADFGEGEEVIGGIQILIERQ